MKPSTIYESPGNLESQEKYFNPICYDLDNRKMVKKETPKTFKLQLCDGSQRDVPLNLRMFFVQMLQWQSYASLRLYDPMIKQENPSFETKMVTLTHHMFTAPLQDVVQNFVDLDIYILFHNDVIMCYIILEQRVFLPCGKLPKSEWCLELKFISTNPRLLSSIDNPSKEFANVR
jgi:hypothetical protein